MQIGKPVKLKLCLLSGQSTMKWFLSGGAIFALCAGMLSEHFGHTANLWAGGVAFIALLIAANLDRISEFKATIGGVEARTRDVVTRAETAISELQLLAAKIAELSLSLVKRQGRLGGYSDAEEDSIRDSMLSVLTKLGLSENKIQSVLHEWHQCVDFDYTHLILGGHQIPDDPTSEVLEEWQALRKGGMTNIPSPQILRRFLSKHGYLTPKVNEHINDYEYYLQNRSHRRPDAWSDRMNWGRLKKE